MPTLTPRKANEVPRGNGVILARNGEATICLKAEREGKEHIQHYLVTLDPLKGERPELVYIDPEDDVIDCGETFSFSMTEGGEGGLTASEKADIGDIFKNGNGLFLKLEEDPKSQKMFAFIDIATGEVKRRQERGVSAVYQEWRVTGLGEDGAVSFLEIREAHRLLG